MTSVFKGPQFYKEEESSIFKGREKETHDLLYIVENSDFSVCYAVSGEGKSSLINAGLCPKLREDGFLPIHIKNIAHAEVGRFDDFVWQKIEDSIGEEREKDRYSELATLNMKPKPESVELYNSIWWKLRTHEFRITPFESVIPVLIFDQFEEVFSSAKDLSWIDTFFSWLEELYQDENPTVGEYSGKLQKNFKILFSLRSEYVCELDYWGMTKHFIPSLKNNRYYLKPLTKSAAIEISKFLDSQPGKLSYDNIIKYAKAEHIGEWDGLKEDLPCVSALILSLILTGLSEKDQEVESKVERLGTSSVDDEGKKLFDFLLDNVYKKALVKCDAVNNIAVKNYVEALEDTLVDMNGRRRHVSERELPQITDEKVKEALTILENERIINVIDHHYELSHDSLCPIIGKRKEERLAAEAKAREEELFRVRRKNLMKKFLFVSAAALVTIGLIVFIGWSVERNNVRKKYQGISVAYAANILNQRGDKFTAQLVCLEQLESMQNPPHELVTEFRKSLNNPSTIIRTSEWVRTLCFSPDGEKFITGSDDGKVIFWDAKEGIPIDTIQAYDEYVFNVLMSSDGSVLMTSNGRVIKIWDAATKKLKKQIAPKDVFIETVAFSPDGKQIVTSSLDRGGNKGITCLWDIETGDSIITLRKSYIGNNWAEFSSDGKYVIGGDTDPVVEAYVNGPLGPIRIPGPVTRFWDARTGKPIKTLKAEAIKNGISPDTQRLLFAQGDSVLAWNIETDDTVRIEGHFGGIDAASFSADGNYILTAANNIVRIWNKRGDYLLYSLSGTGGVLDAKISPDSKTIVASFGDRYIRLLDIEYVSARVLDGKDGWDGGDKTITNLGDTLCYRNGVLAYSPDGLYLANACSDECIRIWKAKNGEFYRKLVCLERYRDAPYLMSFSKDGGKLAAIYYGFINEIKVWDVEKGEELCSLPYQRSHSVWESIAFSPDSKQITLTRDSIVYIWNWEQNVLDSLVIDGSPDNAIFSPDGKHMAIEAYDIIIIDCQSHEIIKTIKRPSGGELIRGKSLSYSYDGKYILSSVYNTVVIWSVETGMKYRELENWKRGFTDIQFSPDGMYVWGKGDDFFVVWDVETRQIVYNRQFERRFSDNAEWKTLRPDGTVSGGVSGYIPTYMAISPIGGQYAYTDGTSIQIWEWPSLEELMNRVRMRFKHRKLTPEERKMYYLDD